jgi:hypothetical protein
MLVRSLSLFAVVACAASTPEPARPPERALTLIDCPDEKTLAAANERYQQALQVLGRCDEICRKTSIGGNQVMLAYEELHQAALEGSREAQFLHGKTTFDFAFLSSLDAALPEKDIVQALTFLRLAILRRSQAAAQYMPALGKVDVEVNGTLKGEPPEEPLNRIPREWLMQALEDARSAFRCYPPPK